MRLLFISYSGQIRNIHFPFDIEADTSISVATEMVAELDLTDQDVTAIAEMIDSEIQAHVPEWVGGEGLNDHDNDMVDSDTHESEAKDELHALPNESDHSPGGLVLEQLPSGRRYWSDSPKGSGGGSPSCLTQSNRSSDFNSPASDDFSFEFSEKHVDPLKSNDQKVNNDSPHSTESGEDNHEGVTSASLEPASASSHKETCSDQELVDNQNEATSDKNEMEHEHLDKTLSVSETEALESVAHKLEKLFMQHQNEIEELKRKHGMAIAQLLQKVPPELRIRIFNMCRMKLPDYSNI